MKTFTMIRNLVALVETKELSRGREAIRGLVAIARSNRDNGAGVMACKAIRHLWAKR